MRHTHPIPPVPAVLATPPVDSRMRQEGLDLRVPQQICLRHPLHDVNAGGQDGHVQRAGGWEAGWVEPPDHCAVEGGQRRRQAPHHVAAGGAEGGAKAAGRQRAGRGSSVHVAFTRCLAGMRLTLELVEVAPSRQPSPHIHRTPGPSTLQDGGQVGWQRFGLAAHQ